MAIVVMVLKEVLKALLLALLSETFIKELLLYFLQWLVKKTDNDIDDEMVEMFRRAVYKQELDGVSKQIDIPQEDK